MVCLTLVAIALTVAHKACARDVKYEHSLQELELTKHVTIPHEKCKSDSTYVFVHSAATTSGKYFERRQTTRETWAERAIRDKFDVIFVLGQPRNHWTQLEILEESHRFNDILQFAFIDDYHNLTLKALSLLRWVSLNCMTGRYIVKTDDDVLVNSERLGHYINSGLFSSGITGKLFTNSKPVQDFNDENAKKWFVPKDIYDKDYYPSYLSGAAYVMSTDVIPKLYTSAVEHRSVLYIDDLYLTGIISHAYNISIHDSTEFFLSSSDDELCGIEVCKLHVISIFHGCTSVNQTTHLWNSWTNTTKKSCRDSLAKHHSSATSLSLIVSMILYIFLAIVILVVIWQLIKPGHN